MKEKNIEDILLKYKNKTKSVAILCRENIFYMYDEFLNVSTCYSKKKKINDYNDSTELCKRINVTD